MWRMGIRYGIALLLLIAGACLPAQSASRERILIRCVDLAGKPVAGAEVQVWQYRPLPYQWIPSAPFVTDANGPAATAIALTYDGGQFCRRVYARVPGELVGATVVINSIYRPRNSEPLEVKMQPSRSLRGSITAPKGSDLTKVRVRVMSLTGIAEDNKHTQFFSRFVRRSLLGTRPDLFECPVRADGTFELRNIPQRAVITLAAEGPGLAQGQWASERRRNHAIPDSISIMMESECVYSGTVLEPNGKPCKGAEVWLIPRKVSDIFSATCDVNGVFRIAGLPAGELTLGATSDAGVFRGAFVELRPQEHLSEQQVLLEHGLVVAGVVTEEDNGKPVVGAELSASSDDLRGHGLGIAKTDLHGRFTMRLPKGSTRLRFSTITIPCNYPLPEVVIEVHKGNVEMTRLALQLSRTQ